MEILDQKRLKELLDYDPDTGIFTWKKRSIDDFSHCKVPIRARNSWNSKNANIVTNNMRAGGYIGISINKNPYLAHRLAFLFMVGYLPECDIDHINRIRDDNRWDNLREVSKQCNARNCGVRVTNTSGVTGVSWYKSTCKWYAQINIDSSVMKNLGRFNNLDDAVNARWKAELKYDYPNCNTTSSAYEYLKEHNLL